MQIRNAALTASFVAEAAAAATRDCSKCTQTIQRDIAVIGGGAAGAHAAVWLRDHDHTVVVVDKASQLVSSPPLLLASRSSADHPRAATLMLTPIL
jgi:heterodisulfide reductase subunit A-like polyferredoxin